jgi:putative ABC transport system permease protein
MRVFGASGRQLRLAQLSGFAAIGLLAGTVAAIAAGTISGLIATRVFDLPWAPDWRLAAYGGFAGMLAVSITGLVATRGVASAPPTVTLRALQG